MSNKPEPLLGDLRKQDVGLVAAVGQELVHSVGRRFQAEGYPVDKAAPLMQRTLLLALASCVFASPETDKEAKAADLAQRLIEAAAQMKETG